MHEESDKHSDEEIDERLTQLIDESDNEIANDKQYEEDPEGKDEQFKEEQFTQSLGDDDGWLGYHLSQRTQEMEEENDEPHSEETTVDAETNELIVTEEEKQSSTPELVTFATSHNRMDVEAEAKIAVNEPQCVRGQAGAAQVVSTVSTTTEPLQVTAKAANTTRDRQVSTGGDGRLSGSDLKRRHDVMEQESEGNSDMVQPPPLKKISLRARRGNGSAYSTAPGDSSALDNSASRVSKTTNSASTNPTTHTTSANFGTRSAASSTSTSQIHPRATLTSHYDPQDLLGSIQNVCLLGLKHTLLSCTKEKPTNWKEDEDHFSAKLHGSYYYFALRPHAREFVQTLRKMGYVMGTLSASAKEVCVARMCSEVLNIHFCLGV